MEMNKDDAVLIIRCILSCTSSSYSVSNLNKEFRNETGMDIPFFGYGNISDFLHSIPGVVKLTGIYPLEQVSLVTNEKSAHIVSLVRHQKCGKQRKIFSNKNASRRTRYTARQMDVQEHQKMETRKGNLEEIKEQNKEDQNLLSLEPFCLKQTRLCTDEEVPPIDLKLHACVGEYIEVCPCEVLSPDKFYFHLRKFKKRFECFMNDLQTFYATHEKEIPKIIASLVRPKQICAVFHELHSEAKWYRAEISKVVNDFRVIVNFIDFGSSSEILKDDIKFLHGNFISLPRQSCLGSLANIKPFSSEWSSLAVKRFNDLAFRKDLVAGVVYMDAEGCCAGVALSSTKGKEIHINDTLVKEGFAEFKNSVLDTEFTERSEEENPLTKSKFNYDRRPLFTERTQCDKSQCENFPISVHSENLISSGINNGIFYAPIIYSSNCRLKKMFSIVGKVYKNKNEFSCN